MLIERLLGDYAMNVYKICLDIGLMEIKYIETPEGEWIDDYDELNTFSFSQIFDSSDILNDCINNISLTFDGDLDDPSIFESIKAVAVHGPRFIVEDSALSLSDVSFYFQIQSTSDLDIDTLEDLIHLIEPVIEKNGHTIAFGEFMDWSVDFDDDYTNTKPLNIEWVSS